MKSTKDAITLKKIERKKILYPYMKKILREEIFTSSLKKKTINSYLQNAMSSWLSSPTVSQVVSV